MKSFQKRVTDFLFSCFGAEAAIDKKQRTHRFLEEALELAQSCNCTAEEAHILVNYVFSRDIGEPHQEVGGVMITLAGLCSAHELNMSKNGETELSRIWTIIDAIRAKHSNRPKNSPLPQ